MTNFLFNQGRNLRWWGLFVLAMLLSSGLNAQTSVSGTVSDDGGPIPGVNVILKGTTKGTSTDFDGNFSIDAPSNGVLVFSYLGYKSQEVSINGQSQINIVMEEDLQSLSEVVVIGYGTQNKESVTGSVVSIKGDELNKVQAANFQEALQGRAPGVNITTTDTRWSRSGWQ